MHAAHPLDGGLDGRAHQGIKLVGGPLQFRLRHAQGRRAHSIELLPIIQRRLGALIAHLIDHRHDGPHDGIHIGAAARKDAAQRGGAKLLTAEIDGSKHSWLTFWLITVGYICRQTNILSPKAPRGHPLGR